MKGWKSSLFLFTALFAFPVLATTVPPLTQTGTVPPGVIVNPTAIPNDVRYEAPIDLGSLGTLQKDSSGIAINNSGVVVGVTATPPIVFGPVSETHFKGFIWKNNIMTLVPPVNPLDYARDLTDINNSGVAVGTDWDGIAYTTYNGVSQPLPHLSSTNKSQAYGISDSGKAVGVSKNSNGKFRAVVWQNGTITDIGTLPGYPSAFANGINDSGTYIVGQSAGNAPLRAVVWDQTHTIYSLDNDPNSSGSTARAVNNSGVVAGSLSFIPVSGFGYKIPVRWVNGQMEKLNGNNMGESGGINNHGKIVGAFGDFNLRFFYRAFLWDNGKFYDLNTLIPPNSGWILTGAAGINDRGEITGTGVYHGVYRGYLLKPKP